MAVPKKYKCREMALKSPSRVIKNLGFGVRYIKINYILLLSDWDLVKFTLRLKNGINISNSQHTQEILSLITTKQP